MSRVRRLAIISNEQLSGERGGAEAFHSMLTDAFKKQVPYVDLLEIPCSEATFDDVLKGYLSCYDLDLSAYDGVITSKAPTFAVGHPNHVCYLMHTVRVFYDMFEELHADPAAQAQQQLILRLDREMLSSPRTKKCFTIGHEVSARLKHFTGVESQPLHPGISREGFYCRAYGDYVFMPGRLHRWKRVDLAIRAMEHTKSPIRLLIAGTGEQEAELERLAGGDKRIEFLGYVEDDEVQRLYADALMVACTPLREDYGYVLQEAYRSEKPVVTCTDSGEPARFVRDGENGFVVIPKPEALAKAFDRLFFNREEAVQMGRRGKADTEGNTWAHVVASLLEALEVSP